MSEIKHGYPNNPHTTPPAGSPGKRSFFNSSWALEVIDAPGAWLIPVSSAEQTVCQIDAGFNLDHQDLAPTDSAGEIIMDMSGEDQGHGTRVAGIIAAAHGTGYGRAGVCPGARILAFQVGAMALPFIDLSLARFGISFDMMAGRIGEAIGIMNRNFGSSEYRVLNISKAMNAGRETAEGVARKYIVTEVDGFLNRGGVLVVGGENASVLAAECFPAAIKQVSSKPAGILVVSSIAHPGNDLWDGMLDAVYCGQNDVDVYAPGGPQEVLNYFDPHGYVTDSGNSLAIPHVAGVAAHLFRINPALDGEKIATTIRETAELQITLNSGATIRVVNAFAAALKVYNEHKPEDARAGYRVILPVEFNEGTLEVNGEIVPVVCIAQLNHSFCRFTAPKDMNIHARLFKHPSLDTRCCWEGSLQDLLDNALHGSRQSAWTHPAVEELRTVRLQGFALAVCYGGIAREPVKEATVILRDRRRQGKWSTHTNIRGEFLLPFGEPGPYTLTVKEDKEGGAKYEIDMNLQANTIYTEDPCHAGIPYIVLGEPVPNNRVINTFAGMVVVEGAMRREAGKLVGAKGSLCFTASTKTITKEIFVYHCYETFSGQSIEEAIEDLAEPVVVEDLIPDEAMPDISRMEIKAFSNFHGELANGFNNIWQGKYGSFEPTDEYWYPGQEIPPGFLLGESSVTLDFPQLTQRVLETYFRTRGSVSFPYTVDLNFCFYADSSRAQGVGMLSFLGSGDCDVTVAEVPCQSTGSVRLSDNRWGTRVVAGPCQNALHFVKHPDNPMQIETDPEPPPAGCISAILTYPLNAGSQPSHLSELFVVGSQGEIGKLL